MSDTITVSFLVGDSRDKRIVALTDAETLMEAAVANGIPGILADCGGACSCGTCRVDVLEGWIEHTGFAHDIETDLLELTDNPTENSRLSCQINLHAGLDGLVVAVPQG
jgi:2Fe-2S ferredoxin